MPFVTFNSADSQRAGLLTGRVLIGRGLSHGIILTDPASSRLHAWIDRAPDQTSWVVTDAGSGTGTFVNGKQTYRHVLDDDDQITIGQVLIVYHETNALPAGVPAMDFSPTGEITNKPGILFDCGTCHAPLWVSTDLAGKRGLCRHCKESVTVPAPPLARGPARVLTESSPPASIPATPKKQPPRCAVCHSSIYPDEPMTTCPECAMRFHTDCWQENFGCSSYGCSQVDILNPNPKTAETAAHAPTTDESQVESETDYKPKSAMPLEMVALAASIAAAILGAIAFGLPAAFSLIWCVILLGRGFKKPLLIVSLLICLAGIAGGLVVSDMRYYDGVHLPFKI